MAAEVPEHAASGARGPQDLDELPHAPPVRVVAQRSRLARGGDRGALLLVAR